MEKKCCKCKVLKSVDDFYKRKSSGDGLQSNCKDCAKISAKVNKTKKPQDKIKRAEYHREYQRRLRSKVEKPKRKNAASNDSCKHYIKLKFDESKILDHGQLYRKVLMMMPVPC